MSETSHRPFRCAVCGAEMTVAPGTTFYPECGLDNVQLIDVPVWTCPLGHSEVKIPDLDQLHHVLAEVVVHKKTPLNGAEIRFLRKAVGMNEREFSGRIAISREYLSRIEHGHETSSKSLELLIRLFYACASAEITHRPIPTDIHHALDQLEKFNADLGTYAHRLMYAEPEHAGWDNAGSTWLEATA